jgi:hypothetical protein
VPALGCMGVLTGAGVAISKLVEATMLAESQGSTRRRSAVARIQAWAMFAVAAAALGAAALAEQSWRVALVVGAVVQLVTAVAQARWKGLPRSTARRPFALPGRAARRVLGAWTTASAAVIVLHGLLAVLLGARGLGPLAVALITTGSSLVTAALVHRVGRRSRVAPAAPIALAGYATLATSTAVTGRATGLAVVTIAVAACQLGSYLMLVAINNRLAGHGASEQLTGVIVGRAAMVVGGLAVAGIYSQLTRLGVALPGVAATLAALAGVLIILAVWRNHSTTHERTTS